MFLKSSILLCVLLWGSVAWSQSLPVRDTLTSADTISKVPVEPTLGQVKVQVPTGLQWAPDSAYPQKVHLGKTIGLGVLAASSYAAAYYAVFYNAWWDKNGGDFNFADDGVYAVNVDKMAHFYGGYYIAQGFYDGLRWAGLRRGPAYFWGGVLSSATQVAIDVKDGYSPEWGFSWQDVTAGTLGAFLPWLQSEVDLLRPMRLRFSYWVRDEAYWESYRAGGADGYWIDDYRNHDYWLTYLVEDALPPKAQKWWPNPLALSLGVGMARNQNPFDTLITPKRRYTFGLDWDWENTVQSDSWAMRRSLFYLGFLKLPAPSIVLWPKLEYHLSYPIVF